MVITINGKKVECLSWEALSVGMLQKIYSGWEVDKDVVERDFLKLLCILAGSQYGSFKETEENKFLLWTALKWITDPIPYDMTIPESIMWDHKTIVIPKEVQHLSIAQNVRLKNEMKSHKYREEKIAIACAIYLQPLISGGDFEMKKAREICAEIEKQPASQWFGLGFFLLNRAFPSGTSTEKVLSQILNSLKQNLKQILLTSPPYKDLRHLRTWP